MKRILAGALEWLIGKFIGRMSEADAVRFLDSIHDLTVFRPLVSPSEA